MHPVEEGIHMLKHTKAAKAGNGNLGLVERARAEAEHLAKDARRVGVDMQKRAERAMHDLEHGAEKLVDGIEARAVKAMAPVLRRTFATQREVRELRAAVTDLTRRLDELTRAEVARKVDGMAHRPA
jgi:hypothetical protein